MNRNEFTKIIDMLEAAYPARFEKMDYEKRLEFLRTWYRGLSDLKAEDLDHAVIRHIRDNRFFPTIAELREAAGKTVRKVSTRELFDRFANYYPEYDMDRRNEAFKRFVDKVRDMSPEERWNEVARIKSTVIAYVQACELDREELPMPLNEFLERIGV